MEDKIIQIAQKIKKAGGDLYLVGGAIRDELLGKEVHDKDFCVTGLTEDEFIKLFPEAHIRGKAFSVFDIDENEFALARTEKKVGKGHKEFEIVNNKELRIQEDLKRRDITINSIAQDVLTKQIIDPFKGQQDIKNKLIRHVSSNFKEDPLRVYRVARFAASLEFNVDEETINLMNSLKGELNTLSKERVFVEFKKAMQTDKPSIFFEILKKADVLDIHFKEIYDLIGSLQPEKYHPEGDSYNHTIITVDTISKYTKNLEIRFSGLVHDLGKGTTPKQMYPHHYGHDERGVELVSKLGKRIGVPKSWIKCGKAACKYHMKGGIFYKMTPAKKVKFIEEVSKTYLGLDGMQLVVNADKNRKSYEDKDIEFAKIGKEMLEKIDGKYIEDKYKIKPGILLGEKLHQERTNWMKKYEK